MSRYGRKTTIYMCPVIFIMGWIIYIAAENIVVFYVGRFIHGLGVGITAPVVSVYISEISHPDIRGITGAFPMTLSVFGVLLSYISGIFVDYKMTAALSAIPCIIMLVLLIKLPKSPKWLMKQDDKDRISNVKHCISLLRGSNYDSSLEIKEMEENIDRQKSESESISVLCKWRYLKPLLLCTALMFIRGSSGVYNVIFLASSIFSDSTEELSAEISSVIVGAVLLFGTIIALFVSNKLGRRILLSISGLFMSVTMYMLGIYYYFKANDYDVSEYSWIPLVFLVCFMFSYSIGFCQVPYMLLGEMLPVKVRDFGSNLGEISNTVGIIGIAQLMYPTINVLGHHGLYWLYATIALVGLIFVILFIPETEGKSLEKIEKENCSTNNDLHTDNSVTL